MNLFVYTRDHIHAFDDRRDKELDEAMVMICQQAEAVRAIVRTDLRGYTRVVLGALETYLVTDGFRTIHVMGTDAQHAKRCNLAAIAERFPAKWAMLDKDSVVVARGVGNSTLGAEEAA